MLVLSLVFLTALLFQGCTHAENKQSLEQTGIVIHPHERRGEAHTMVHRKMSLQSLIQTFGSDEKVRLHPSSENLDEWDSVMTVGRRQQAELNKDYAKMLQLDDPDDVEKATQLAWLKMDEICDKKKGPIMKNALSCVHKQYIFTLDSPLKHS
eukprot:GEMP01069197.1.p1 GENE.GEMP01069197.1~~GEMP01069197.1.p1  ORF type:complete len:153 (+),score=20.18 GEMP01069197.1:223-681(+)